MKSAVQSEYDECSAGIGGEESNAQAEQQTKRQRSLDHGEDPDLDRVQGGNDDPHRALQYPAEIREQASQVDPFQVGIF